MSESKCPFHKVRPELPALTPRIAALPVDERGYPVPFFVAWVDGKPEFRMADAEKLKRCVLESLCWVCGGKLGTFLAFPIGPMCAINRTTAEPPSHYECAEWSVLGCPFLSKPQMVRREDELTEAHAQNIAGVSIRRNPGVTAIWTTKSYRRFPDGNGRALIRVGEPVAVSWWREGRPATRAEVLESIETGIPHLLAVCQDEEEAAELWQHRATFEASGLLPREVRG